MEILAPGIVLSVAPFGEGDALVSVFSEEHGVYRGLAHGGQSRTKASLWQQGNLVQARWVARLADQLGSFSAELIHPGAALAMDDAWALGILSSACAVAETALPEREPHAAIFRGLLHLVVHAPEGRRLLGDMVRWELGLLRELGYGLDLSECALTGTCDSLAFVSPRTGRAVCAEAAGLWKERLLKLPAFLTTDADGDMEQWAEGLRLTGHFLARDAFGLHHRPVPAARTMLEEKTRAAAEL
ncbi:MAG: DNA repair protein RecO [Rhodospirillales bacterium]